MITSRAGFPTIKLNVNLLRIAGVVRTIVFWFVNEDCSGFVLQMKHSELYFRERFEATVS
jgi:hypothetical protein